MTTVELAAFRAPLACLRCTLDVAHPDRPACAGCRDGDPALTPPCAVCYRVERVELRLALRAEIGAA